MKLVVPDSDHVALNVGDSKPTTTTTTTAPQQQPANQPQAKSDPKKSCWWSYRDVVAVANYGLSGLGAGACAICGGVVNALGSVSQIASTNSSTTVATPSNTVTTGVSYVLFVTSAGLAIATVTGVVIHVLWRRDGRNANLRKSADEMDKEVQRVLGVDHDQQAALQKLIEQDTLLKQNEQKLETLHDAFTQERTTLNQTVDRLTQTNLGIAQQNATLSNQNQLLSQQVQRLQQVLTQVKECLVDFTNENKQLKTQADNLTHVVLDFGKQEQAFTLAVSDIDKTLSVDIGKIAEQVQLTQKTSEQVLEAFAEKILDLQKTINQLKDTEKQIVLDEKALRDKDQQLGLLQKQLLQVQSALQDSQAQYSKISLSLSQTKQELATTLQQLQEAEQKMSKDSGNLQNVIQPLADLANKLDSLSSKVAQDVQSLNDLSSKTKKQSDEISKL